MRAALLPTTGEPFLLACWLRNFVRWRDEVDELLVCINANSTPGLAEELVRAAGVRQIPSTLHYIGHGTALRELLQASRADHVVLCEDDAYVRTRGSVGEAFKRIELDTVDVIGSPRCEDEFGSLNTDWPEAPIGEFTDLSRALWPTFLFAHRADLLATDQRFGDIVFAQGEYIPGLNIEASPEWCVRSGPPPTYIHVDTFYATTFQLRGLKKRIELVHQVRVVEPHAAKEWIRNDPPWFHVSGLSAIHTVLNGLVGDLPDPGRWAQRIAWWERTYREAEPSLRDSGYGQYYRSRLDSFRRQINIPEADVRIWNDLFDLWVR